MSTNIFINLPVRDLNKSKAFFTSIGFLFNEALADDSAACMVISENIFAILLTHAKFQQFTPKKIPDGKIFTEVINCISTESKKEVDEIVDKAMAAGGREARKSLDYSYMYGRSFNDLDGHIWEIMWIDEFASKLSLE